jgi:pimeloyl-ACP methyl ester carboxylesterase
MDSAYGRILTVGDRQIGYALAANKSNASTAIVYFYPISGSSLVWVQNIAPSLSNYECSFLCVDRPSCGSTSPLDAPPAKQDPALHRIQGAVQDVMAVLQHEKMERIFVLGVCLGHVYAIHLCRQLINTTIMLQGLTLVAPFVAPYAKDSWWVARLGASVPSMVLYGCTETAASMGNVLLSQLLTPKRLQKLVTPEEQEEYGWTDQDFEQACDMALSMGQLTRHSMAVEARLGANPVWQEAIIDKFAQETGLGTKLDGEVPVESPSWPLRIYASADDKVAPLKSVEWVAERCYGGKDKITVIPTIHSHEVMTFLGGPPRNPVLLHQIAREWGLLQDER